MNKQMLRLAIGAVALAASGAAAADGQPAAAPYEEGPSPGTPYIEQVGSGCMLVNVYLEQRDGVAEQIVLREPVECSGSAGDDLAVADLSP